jgi:predicted small integral membrane protein
VRSGAPRRVIPAFAARGAYVALLLGFIDRRHQARMHCALARLLDSFPSAIRYRAITDPMLQQAAYLLIIATEAAVAVLCWLGAYRLLRVFRADGCAFNRAKTISIVGLTLGILLWQVAFMTIAGEWFGMWMSEQWNGVLDAFRLVMILYASLIFLVVRDDDLRP